jgi:hypothetical protein
MSFCSTDWTFFFCAVTLLLHTKDLWKLSSTTSVRAYTTVEPYKLRGIDPT